MSTQTEVAVGTIETSPTVDEQGTEWLTFIRKAMRGRVPHALIPESYALGDIDAQYSSLDVTHELCLLNGIQSMIIAHKPGDGEKIRFSWPLKYRRLGAEHEGSVTYCDFLEQWQLIAAVMQHGLGLPELVRTGRFSRFCTDALNGRAPILPDHGYLLQQGNTLFVLFNNANGSPKLAVVNKGIVLYDCWLDMDNLGKAST